MAVRTGAPLELIVTGYVTGLVGVVGVEVSDGQGNVVIPRTTAGIIEAPAGSGIYAVTLTAPAEPGTYTVTWDDGGTPAIYAVEQIQVTATGLPELDAGTASTGPCQAWADTNAVGGRCAGEPVALTSALLMASDVLYQLSGRRFPGVCSATVRPVGAGGRCLGDFARWRGLMSDPSTPRGCAAYDRVKLAGYPVRAVDEVRLDGQVVPPSSYALEGGRWLVRRLPDGWPSCQRLDRPAGEVGTWTVTYRFGQEPPVAGRLAAIALACELAKASAGQPCDLPAHVQAVVRQGVTMRRNAATLFGQDGTSGLPEVDAFLAAYRSTGTRRAAIISPDTPRYPTR